MPSPYKGDPKTIKDVSPFDLVTHKITEAALIGAIAMEWSRIENDLAYIFALLVFGIRQAPDVGEHIATHSFELAASFNTKRGMLKDAVQVRVGSVTRDAFNKLLDKLENAQHRRNIVVHGRWALSSDKKELILRSGRGPYKELVVYNSTDLTDILKELRESENALAEFFSKEISPHLKPFDFTPIFEALFSKKDTQGDA